MLKRLLKNRKGTAEVIGSVLFIVILLFFFTNVYLWHDAATKQVNNLYINKMNAGMEVYFARSSPSITAKGSDVMLSRIWIVTSDNQHLYADLTNFNIHLVAGTPTPITFKPPQLNSDGSVKVEGTADGITLYYPQNQITDLKVLNTLGVIV